MVAVALRPYQTEAVDSTNHILHTEDVRSALVVAATGTGKTTTAGELIRGWAEDGDRTLFVAHRKELIDQGYKRFKQFGLKVGIERGSHKSNGEPVIVASMQTMVRRLDKFPPDFFQKIVIDEAHHAVAPGYRDIIAHFPNAKVVGVTATPDRADGIPLGSVFQRLAARYDIVDAVAEGYLVPPRALRIEVPGMDLSKVRQKVVKTPRTEVRDVSSGVVREVPAGEAVDLHPTDLGKAAIDPAAVEGVVRPLLELAGHRRTVVFAVDVNHAKALAASINDKFPNQARVVYGDMDDDERAKNLKDFEANEYQFIVNVMVLTEGWDCPPVECVAMARPTQSRILFAQACGRGLRPYEDKIECLILDFVGVSCRFDLVGPDDVLGDVLVEPTKTWTRQPQRVVRDDVSWAELREHTPLPREPQEVDDPVALVMMRPVPDSSADVEVTFKAKAVDLLRRAGGSVRRAGRRVGGWFARLFGGHSR